MSKTELKNGEAVWLAACELIAFYGNPDHLDGSWLTVGEVANKARVSKNTARKYLDLAVDAGYCNRVRPFGKGAVYYRPFENKVGE